MIRVRRSRQVPEVLKKAGAAARRRDEKAFAKGARAFSFDRTIYGHPTVKRSLVASQHHKCCFCESKVTHISSGQVEHFRPKGGVRQSPRGALKKPGYFWLAYEWTNLLFCCELCNCRFKRNLFPLVDPKARARRSDDDLAREEALFIDPASEDPARHIGYREEYPFAVDGSRRGEATWRELGLDREELAELRRDHLQMVKALKNARDGGSLSAADQMEADELLARLTSDKAQWSAMVRAAMEP